MLDEYTCLLKIYLIFTYIFFVSGRFCVIFFFLMHIIMFLVRQNHSLAQYYIHTYNEYTRYIYR